MTKIRPFLKWAGSKYNCLNHILTSLPKGQRLIEPFAGSGVVFMNTNYASSILAESNPDLIELFTNLQQYGEEFIGYCQQYFNPKNNEEPIYYKHRDEFNQLKQGKKRSALFLYLNRHGYNGLCRYNSTGAYNVPFGRYIKPYFPLKEMQAFYQKSLHAQFVLSDFRETFKLATRGDVIYCDPPYVPLFKHTNTLSYTQKKFSNADQIELAELAQSTAAEGIPVIISNHDTEFIRHHYKNATIKSFKVSRWINCKAEERFPVQEVIALFE